MLATFPIPPKKIACGLFHSASICNLNLRVRGDRKPFLTGHDNDDEKDQSDKTELYVWGRNSNNVLGLLKNRPKIITKTIQERLAPEKIDSEFFGDFASEGYEVACGVNHTLYVIKHRVDKQYVTDVFSYGLGDFGRLGVSKTNRDPTKPGSESWYTEGRARRVEFTTAYQVVKDKEDTKQEGIPYWDSIAACKEGKDQDGVIEWDSIVHLIPAQDGWFQVQGNFDSPRFMQTTGFNRAPWLMPCKADVLRVSCGSDHSLCLLNSGWLFAWGLNDDGQCGVGGDLGDGTDCVLTPAPVCFEQKCGLVTHFAAGARHSLMTHSTGRLYSWGCSKQGRLGIGKVEGSHNEPQIVESQVELGYVACGEAHSGALDFNRNVWMWGAGAHGRLGLGETIDVPTPRLVEVLEDVDVTQLVLGGFHTVALSTKPHKIFTWGMGHAVGQSHDGEVWSALPQAVSIIVDSAGADLAGEVTQIAAGTYHTMFLLKDGRVASCGLGLSGRLGQGHTRNVGVPHLVAAQVGFALEVKGDAAVMKFKHYSEQTQKDDKTKEEVDGLEGKKKWNVKEIGCGTMHSVALTRGGSVYVWGDNYHGQLGLKDKDKDLTVWLPKRLAFTHQVKGIAVGFEHCLAYTVFGLYVWGKGESGQLGTGRTHTVSQPTKVDDRHFGGCPNVIGIAAGDDHSLAIVSHTDSSSLYSWGSSDMGKLGIWPIGLEQYLHPEQVVCDFDKKFPVAVTCGPYHTAVIVAEDVDDREGNVFTFGGGTYGRLGVREDQQNIFQPEKVSKWPQVGTQPVGPCSAIACGSYHTCAITRDSKHDTTELFLWGDKEALCEVENALVPKRFGMIEGASRFKAVVCNACHSFLISESGEVYAWGRNYHGQLSLSPKLDKNKLDKPELLKTIPGSVDLLAAGPQHAITLLENGNMYAWGNQSCGRLGLTHKKAEKIVWQPSMVKAEWASIEEITNASGLGKPETGFADDGDADADDDAEDGKGDEAAEGAAHEAKADENTFEKSMIDSLKSGQKVQLFATMQSLLKNEPESSREHTFKKVEEDLSAKLKGYLQDIHDLPEKEKDITRSQSDLTVALSTTVKHIRNGKLKPPAVGGASNGQTVDDRILVKMKYYEDMMWVLQQQPSYLSALSMCNLNQEDVGTFYTVIHCLYDDLKDSRTLHLFMALLKMLISKEVEHAKDLRHVFTRADSRVFHVFSHFALQPVHYDQVVHPFMKLTTEEEDRWEEKLARDKKQSKKDAQQGMKQDKEESKEDKKKWSLYRRIVEKSAKQVFALSEEDYKKQAANQIESLDKDEITAKFISDLEKFKEFMQHDFLDALKNCTFHPNVRTILDHCLRTVQGRKFPGLSGGDQRIAEDLLVCQPLLSLIVSGLLERMLSEQKFAGQAVMLPKSNAKDLDDSMVIHNMQMLRQFLENLVDGKYEESSTNRNLVHGDRVLVGIARYLKPALLKYVQEQATYSDNVDTQLIIDAFTSHFDVTSRRVSVPTSSLLSFSNILQNSLNKLRQTDEDPLEAIAAAIGTWSDQDIEKSRQDGDLPHNFVIRHRFLLTEQECELTVCKASQCPMPPRLCSSGIRNSDGYTVIQTFSVESGDQPWRILEEIFREINDVKATTWKELGQEFEGMLKEATTKSPPNYALAHRLDGGIAKVKAMSKEEQSVPDVLQHMSDKLLARSKHQVYLEQVQRGIHHIRKAKLNHDLQQKRAELELKQMVKFATGLKLPHQLVAAAQEGGEFLMLEKVAKKQYMGRTTNLEKLGGNRFLPSQVYTYKDLMKRHVINEIEGLPDAWKRNTTIKFTGTDDGGVSIDVGVRQKKSVNTLRSMQLDKDQVNELRKAAEGATLSLPSEGDAAPIVFHSAALNKILKKLLET